MLNEQVKSDVKKALSNLKDDVKLVVFTQKMECNFCSDNRKLMEEVAGLSEKITVELCDFVDDKNKVEKYKIDKIPAVAIVGKEDYNIRLYGIPAGYEFSSLIEGIKVVSTGEVALTPDTIEYIKKLDKDIHLQVLVTPTCPYCPKAVITAQHMARLNKKVKADMVEVSEFPQLANKYSVHGVPKTVVNETFFLEGAAPDNLVVDKIKEALK